MGPPPAHRISKPWTTASWHRISLKILQISRWRAVIVGWEVPGRQQTRLTNLDTEEWPPRVPPGQFGKALVEPNDELAAGLKEAIVVADICGWFHGPAQRQLPHGVLHLLPYERACLRPIQVASI